MISSKLLVIVIILASLPLPRDASPKDNPTEIAVSENDRRENSRKEEEPVAFEQVGDKQDLLKVLSGQIMHNASSASAGNYVVIGSEEAKSRRKRASRRPRKFKILPALCG